MNRSRTRRLGVVLAAVALVAGACTDDGGDSSGEASPATTGTAAVTDAAYEATIHRTEGGVPHIVGATLADAAFGQGWASGQDRACDLADQVVKIRGERAATFGAGEDDEHLDSDVAWRTIGIHERALEDWEDAPADVRELFTAYADGWNAHLEAVGAGGLTGWCRDAEWVRPLEPADVYAYSRAITLQASSAQVARYLGAQPPEVPADEGGDDERDDGEGNGGDATTGTTGVALGPIAQPVAASNGWAIGAERSADDGGLLLANPHFPWEGELRFWEVHLTVPGELDVYGAQLSGLPGIGIGFTEDFGWTHTVSAGNRFTAYRLDLVEGDPTTYAYGDEEREMTAEELTIEVLQPDGGTEEVTRTAWYSHYGPILDFPGFGWTEDATITYRDANLDNDEFAEQYLAMLTAEDLDELIAAHEEINGVPLFNTVAVSADGRAWYADTSATPYLSPEALAGYQRSVEEDPIVATAAASRAVLLDGSDPTYEWVEVDEARDPGLVPPADQPMVERDDYVFNANDSFWLPHATEELAGPYSPLHGAQDTARSPRTRQNARVLDGTGADSASGTDGRFDLDELTAAALANEGFTARELAGDVATRCAAQPRRTVEPLVVDGEQVLPGAEVDLTEACEVLADWDATYDLDSVGPVVWRELLDQFDQEAFLDAGELWAVPFDDDEPVATPSGLAPPLDGNRDPVLDRLARAVQVLDEAGIDVGTIVPIHGGNGREGLTNIVGYGTGWSTLEPIPTRGERVVPDSALATTDDRTGYLVNNGTSFLLALAYTDEGPEARVHLTYGNTADRTSPLFVEATERFSEKDWREVRFTEADIEADPDHTVEVVRG